jgi:hypothetical protein
MSNSVVFCDENNDENRRVTVEERFSKEPPRWGWQRLPLVWAATPGATSYDGATATPSITSAWIENATGIPSPSTPRETRPASIQSNTLTQNQYDGPNYTLMSTLNTLPSH